MRTESSSKNLMASLLLCASAVCVYMILPVSVQLLPEQVLGVAGSGGSYGWCDTIASCNGFDNTCDDSLYDYNDRACFPNAFNFYHAQRCNPDMGGSYCAFSLPTQMGRCKQITKCRPEFEEGVWRCVAALIPFELEDESCHPECICDTPVAGYT